MSSPWRHPATRTAIVAGAVLIAGLAREMVLARAFGLSSELDTFLVVASIPMAAIAVFSGTFQSAAVPVITEVLQEPPQSGVGFHAVLRRYAAALAGLTIAWFGVTQLVPETLAIFVFAPPGPVATVMLVVTVVFGAIVAALSAYGLAVGLSTTVTLAPAAVPLATAIVVLMTDQRTSVVLFGGLLIGNISAAASLFGALRRAGAPISSLRMDGRFRRKLLRRGSILAPGTIVMAMTAPVDLYFAGVLITGAAAALNFGGKVPLALIGIGGVVISNVVFPAMSRRAVARDFDALRATARRWTVVSVVAGIASATLVIMASDVLIAVLYAGGDMRAEALPSISRVQQMFALSLPTFWMGLVWSRALIALDDTVTIAWIGLVAFVVNGVGNHILSGALGVSGIALATSVMYLVTTSIAGLRLRLVLGRRIAQ
ncbi:MAG TPA: lipid II flippase MurJ [Ilumatobacter sp.]|nr:lipid II flippase MurJ [Ilumatobacter sp.]